jgi:hypothetical protein
MIRAISHYPFKILRRMKAYYYPTSARQDLGAHNTTKAMFWINPPELVAKSCPPD